MSRSETGPKLLHYELIIIKVPVTHTQFITLLQLVWQHVSTLLGHHQAFTMNQLTIKLHTFLGSQTLFISDNYKQFSVS